MSADYIVVKELMTIDLFASLKGEEVLLLVGLSNFFHCLNIAALVLQSDRRVNQVQRIIALLIHDLGEKHELEGCTSLGISHRTIALEGLIEVRIGSCVVLLIRCYEATHQINLSLEDRDNVDRVGCSFN